MKIFEATNMALDVLEEPIHSALKICTGALYSGDPDSSVESTPNTCHYTWGGEKVILRKYHKKLSVIFNEITVLTGVRVKHKDPESFYARFFNWAHEYIGKVLENQYPRLFELKPVLHAHSAGIKYHIFTLDGQTEATPEECDWFALWFTPSTAVTDLVCAEKSVESEKRSFFLVKPRQAACEVLAIEIPYTGDNTMFNKVVDHENLFTYLARFIRRCGKKSQLVRLNRIPSLHQVEKYAKRNSINFAESPTANTVREFQQMLEKSDLIHPELKLPPMYQQEEYFVEHQSRVPVFDFNNPYTRNTAFFLAMQGVKRGFHSALFNGEYLDLFTGDSFLLKRRERLLEIEFDDHDLVLKISCGEDNAIFELRLPASREMVETPNPKTDQLIYMFITCFARAYLKPDALSTIITKGVFGDVLSDTLNTPSEYYQRAEYIGASGETLLTKAELFDLLREYPKIETARTASGIAYLLLNYFDNSGEDEKPLMVVMPVSSWYLSRAHSKDPHVPNIYRYVNNVITETVLKKDLVESGRSLYTEAWSIAHLFNQYIPEPNTLDTIEDGFNVTSEGYKAAIDLVISQLPPTSVVPRNPCAYILFGKTGGTIKVFVCQDSDGDMRFLEFKVKVNDQEYSFVPTTDVETNLEMLQLISDMVPKVTAESSERFKSLLETVRKDHMENNESHIQ